jgi:transmembrane sensor
MEEDQFYNSLVKKFTDGSATNDELEVFINLVNEGKFDKQLIEAMDKEADIIQKVDPKVYAIDKSKTLLRRLAIAASIIFAISAGAYIFFSKRVTTQQVVQIQKKEIVPGSNQATLTLANGQKIILSRGLSGKVAQQGNTQIKVNKENEVVYSQEGGTTAVLYNTLSTAIGEASPYPLVLADGTKVWLNSESTIKFPTAFTGANRQVEITGEAYFEVVHNASNPFIVKVGNQTVEDIGTAFNINSYHDEPNIKTTLTQGSAKVSANGLAKILQPGQHTLVTPQSILLQTADSDAETAWIKNMFVFHDEELHSAMRQLSRWYNIDVVYNYNPKNVLLGGRFSKSRNINKLLKAFEQTGAVKFKIEGRAVHITE